MPRIPKPPGTQIASTSESDARAPSALSHSSLAIHFKFTFALFAKPPARSASLTDRYASGRSTYLPTRPMVI